MFDGNQHVFLLVFLTSFFQCFLLTRGSMEGYVQYMDDCKEYRYMNGEWVPTGNLYDYCCYYSWDNYLVDWNNAGHNYKYFYDQYYGLGKTVPTPNCSELVCTSMDTWQPKALDPSSCTESCEYEGYQYRVNWTRYGDDCFEYVCQNRSWENTTNSDRKCCYYYQWYNDWYYYNDGYHKLHENVTENGCVLTCAARDKWEAVDCKMCVYNNQQYFQMQFLYQNDCMQYSCEYGNWVPTGVPDPNCCYYYNWQNYGYQTGHYGLNEIIYRYNCSDLVCIAKNTWYSEDCKMCQFQDSWYHPRQTTYRDDCKEYICNNGDWEETGNTNLYCCFYNSAEYEQDWGNVDYDYEGIQDYKFASVGLNGTVPSGNCSERVCIAANTWTHRKLDPANCDTCDYNGGLYRINKTRFGGDCYQYICKADHTWEKTNVTDKNCCWNDYYYSWINDIGVLNNTCTFYGGADEFYYGYYGPQKMIVLPNCTKIICVGYSTWKTVKFDVTQSKACDYEGYLYGDNVTRFGNDCYEYICRNGTWEKTLKKDSQCCWNYYDDYWSLEEISCAFYGNGYGFYAPQDIYVSSNCTVYTCVGYNTWEALDTDVSSLGACYQNGFLYKNGTVRYEDNCLEYRCSHGEWNLTGQTDPFCCYNYFYYEWDFWYDYNISGSVKYYAGLNESVSHGNCTELVCVSREQWQKRPQNTSNCCEENGYYYIPGQMRYKNDCYAYVCEDGQVKKTSSIHPQCCYYSPWDYYSDFWYDQYGYLSAYYGLGANISRYNCSDLQCTSRDNWQSNDCKMCTYNGQQYHDKRTLMQNDCKEYLCDNGEWKTTGLTDNYCCFNYYWDYWYDYYHMYVGLNETIASGECVDLVCVWRGQLEARPLNYTDCCEEEGYYYLPGQMRFKDDCYGYVCENSELVKTNDRHPMCPAL